MQNINIKNVFLERGNILLVISIIVMLMPIIIYGQDSFIIIHDFLDGNVPLLKMLKEHSIMFSPNAKTDYFGNISTSYFAMTFNLTDIVYNFFEPFSAIVGTYILKIIIGYFSMYILLQSIFHEKVNRIQFRLISLVFAITPIYPLWWIVVESIPLLIYIYSQIYKTNPHKINFSVLLLILFPLLSNFMIVGLYVIPIWFLLSTIVSIVRKCLHKNLFIGFFALTFGYILTNLGLIYSVVCNNEETTKQLASPTFNTIFTLLKNSLNLFINEGYHYPSLTRFIIIPTIVIVIVGITLYLYFSKADKLSTSTLSLYKRNLRISTVCIITSVFISIIGAMYTSWNIVAFVFPFLDGFNYDRIVIFNRIILYIGFTAVLQIIFSIKKMRLLTYFLVIIQLCICLWYPTAYNFFRYNYERDQIVNMDIGSINTAITYKQFYSEELFQKIRKDIYPSTAKVAAVGYHPSVLMYNGFVTIDGYVSYYPLKYKVEFRKVIAPELDANEYYRNYYDGWGGRLYLFNTDISYQPNSQKYTDNQTINLLIDTNVFRKLGGKYILSRAPIENIDKLNLKFVKEYRGEDSIYNIWLYELAS
jgi:hypothetical protein